MELDERSIRIEATGFACLFIMLKWPMDQLFFSGKYLPMEVYGGRRWPLGYRGFLAPVAPAGNDVIVRGILPMCLKV